MVTTDERRYLARPDHSAADEEAGRPELTYALACEGRLIVVSTSVTAVMTAHETSGQLLRTLRLTSRLKRSANGTGASTMGHGRGRR